MKNYDRNKLIELWNQDKSVKEIAEILGINVRTVRIYAQTHPEECISRDNDKFSHKEYDKEAIAKLCEEGKSVKEIAKIVGISTPTVAKYIKEHPEECKGYQGRFKKFDNKKLVELWQQNKSVSEIARIIGVSPPTVTRYLKEHPEESSGYQGRIKKYDVKKLIEMWNQNMPAKEIAESLSVTTQTVYIYAKNHPEECKKRKRLYPPKAKKSVSSSHSKSNTKKYDEEKLISLWNDNVPIVKIAEHLGICRSTVRRYVKNHPEQCKLASERRKYNQCKLASKKRKYDEEKLISLWNDNVPEKEIAQILGISCTTVRGYAKKHPEQCKLVSERRRYDEKQLISLWNDNVPEKEIAQILGIDRTTVRRYAKSHSEKCKLVSERKYDKEKLISLWNDNVPVVKIAEILRINPATVRNYAKNHPKECKVRPRIFSKKYDENGLISMWNSNIPANKIAEAIGISAKAVADYAKSHPESCKTRGRGKKKHYDETQLISMWNSDIPASKIAEVIGISDTSVFRYVKAHPEVCKAKMKAISSNHAKKTRVKYDTEKLVKLWEHSVSSDIIAKELGVSKATIKKYVRLHRNKCAVRRSIYDEPKLVSMWQQGRSVVEISNEVGVSESVISYYIEKHFEKCGKYDPQEIIDMHKKGKSNKEISEEINLPEYVVSTCLRLQDYERLKKRKNYNDEEIISMWNGGKSITQISKKLGISYTAVAKFVSRHRDLCPYR